MLSKNPVDQVVGGGGCIRVITIPLRGPSDQMRSDSRLELRSQIGPGVAKVKFYNLRSTLVCKYTVIVLFDVEQIAFTAQLHRRV